MGGVRCFQGNQGFIVPCGEACKEPQPPLRLLKKELVFPAFKMIAGIAGFC